MDFFKGQPLGEVFAFYTALITIIITLARFTIHRALHKIDLVEQKQVEILTQLATLTVRLEDVLTLKERVEKLSDEHVELRVSSTKLERDLTAAHLAIGAIRSRLP